MTRIHVCCPREVRRKLRTLDLVDDTWNKDGRVSFFFCKYQSANNFRETWPFNKIATTKLLQSVFSFKTLFRWSNLCVTYLTKEIFFQNTKQKKNPQNSSSTLRWHNAANYYAKAGRELPFSIGGSKVSCIVKKAVVPQIVEFFGRPNSWSPKIMRGLSRLLLSGGFKYVAFSPLFGEDFQFDRYFSDGLKPPTSYLPCFFRGTNFVSFRGGVM